MTMLDESNIANTRMQGFIGSSSAGPNCRTLRRKTPSYIVFWHCICCKQAFALTTRSLSEMAILQQLCLLVFHVTERLPRAIPKPGTINEYEQKHHRQENEIFSDGFPTGVKRVTS